MMRFIRKLHKWAAIVVGIQFLLWLLSGLFFNLMDPIKAAGNTYKNSNNVQLKSKVNQSMFIEPVSVLKNYPEVISLSNTQIMNKPYYLLTHEKGLYKHFKNKYTLVDAYSGEVLVIDKQFAVAIARQSYNGPGQLESIKLLNRLEDFPKQQNRSWQVNFADNISTSVYIEQSSGRIVGHSDDEKRFADIFFMLHFMDYGNYGSFNNVQNMLFAIVTLWLTLTGLIWAVNLGLRGQYSIKPVNAALKGR